MHIINPFYLYLYKNTDIDLLITIKMNMVVMMENTANTEEAVDETKIATVDDTSGQLCSDCHVVKVTNNEAAVDEIKIATVDDTSDQLCSDCCVVKVENNGVAVGETKIGSDQLCSGHCVMVVFDVNPCAASIFSYHVLLDASEDLIFLKMHCHIQQTETFFS